MRVCRQRRGGFTLLEILLALGLSAATLAAALFLLDVMIRDVSRGDAATWETIEEARFVAFLERSFVKGQKRGEVRWVPTHTGPDYRGLDWAIVLPLRSSLLARTPEGRVIIPDQVELGWMEGVGLVYRPMMEGSGQEEIPFEPLLDFDPFIGVELYTFNREMGQFEELPNPSELSGPEPGLRLIHLVGLDPDGKEDRWIPLPGPPSNLASLGPSASPGTRPPSEPPPPPPGGFPDLPPPPSGRPPASGDFRPDSVPDFIPPPPQARPPR